MANASSEVTLFDAAKKGNLDDLRAILNLGKKYVMSRDGRGYSIAHIAAESGTSGVIQWIQKNELDLLNSISSTGYAPIHIACECGFLDVLIALKMAKADLNLLTVPDSMHGAHLCARIGHLQCIQFLHSNKANVNTKDKFGNSPITTAAHNGQKEIVKFLSEALKIAEKDIPQIQNIEDPLNRRLTATEREQLVKQAMEDEKKKLEKGVKKDGTFLDNIRENAK